ncbi:hypothetical protein PLICRDRAFT_57787 [Plicaturopsis crispa FD-325 SS-3]|uniref:Reverse transcriptase domain-containing protein n=1 Tax=Plicaturopsis crispa FD-325 SS-3 TaxID=944288 RepID=A0A0C9SKV3_PLICR|nr:hypothetical protein PLICRDRAFT_57787 [Plicaturopsis crispa FD-325 SS-3]
MLRNSNLRGYNVPGVADKIVTTLFADDTTAYLNERDSFEDLQGVLEKWCIASKAKFNVEKTEVIPIGTEEYRAAVIASRKLHPDQNPLPRNVHIAKEGEPVRILGSWIGNKADQAESWNTVVAKINKSLEQWGKSHPTPDGRRLIIIMVVAGMTQYLTKVQGMPIEVEKTLERIISNFMANGNRPLVGMHVLQKHVTDGGKKDKRGTRQPGRVQNFPRT